MYSTKILLNTATIREVNVTVMDFFCLKIIVQQEKHRIIHHLIIIIIIVIIIITIIIIIIIIMVYSHHIHIKRMWLFICEGLHVQY